MSRKKKLAQRVATASRLTARAEPPMPSAEPEPALPEPPAPFPAFHSGAEAIAWLRSQRRAKRLAEKGY